MASISAIRLLQAALCCGLLLFGTLVRAEDPRTVILSAEDLDLDAASAALSLMRWSAAEAAFEPLPFQIDPLDSVDMVWFADADQQRDAGGERFRGRDQLLFRALDAGPLAPQHAQPDVGKVLREIRLGEPAQAVYVVQDNPRRSAQRYIEHDLAQGVTRTASYELRVNPANELDWRYLGFYSYRGEGSIIDTLKMRMAAGFLNRHARMTLDNDNLRPRQVANKVGPIRSVMHLETKVVLAGIPVMRLQMQAHRYADHYEAHSYAVIPRLYKGSLRAPEVQVTIDGNAQYGARVQTARGGTLVSTVNGHGDVAGAELVERGLSTDESWILFDSQKDFILLAQLAMPPSLQGIPLALVYEDDEDKAMAPEQFQGQLPNLGYSLQGWPPSRELRFAVQLLFDQSLHGMAPNAYAQWRGGQPSLSVRYWTDGDSLDPGA
ncbi:hypothetical protein [Isoalcanivorax beigongshangi]|uniref:Uncharacterized protein n=1 Tax=Isoalcanivorax beigongshangi TaxID=3238810 RepID=A0ABV4AJU4_9GAMM